MVDNRPRGIDPTLEDSMINNSPETGRAVNIEDEAFAELRKILDSGETVGEGDREKVKFILDMLKGRLDGRDRVITSQEARINKLEGILDEQRLKESQENFNKREAEGRAKRERERLLSPDDQEVLRLGRLKAGVDRGDTVDIRFVDLQKVSDFSPDQWQRYQELEDGLK